MVPEARVDSSVHVDHRQQESQGHLFIHSKYIYRGPAVERIKVNSSPSKSPHSGAGDPGQK